MFCWFLSVQISCSELQAAWKSEAFIAEGYLQGHDRMWEALKPAEPDLWSRLFHQAVQCPDRQQAAMALDHTAFTMETQQLSSSVPLLPSRPEFL